MTIDVESETEFKVGDRIVYPAQGICKVIDIEKKQIAERPCVFYILEVQSTGRKIMVPIGNTKAVGLRAVMKEAEVKEIYHLLSQPEDLRNNDNWNRRYRAFMEMIKRGSVKDVVNVLHALLHLRSRGHLSFGERRMLETARGLIVSEICISRNQTMDQVRAEIDALFPPAFSKLKLQTDASSGCVPCEAGQ